VFGGKLSLRGNTHFLEHIRDLNPEDSLWDFWRELQHQFVGAERKTKRQFESMSEQEIRMVGESLYLKWDHRGICQTVEMDLENRRAKVESVTTWAYPKAQPIGKQIIQKIEAHIAACYAKQGYTVEFVTVEVVK